MLRAKEAGGRPSNKEEGLAGGGAMGWGWRRQVNQKDGTDRAKGGPRLKETARKYLVVWLAVAVGLVSTLFLFKALRQWGWDRLQDELERQSQSQAAALQRGLDQNREVVRSIAGLFSASYQVERDEFRSFVHGALTTHGDIQALQWVPRVRDLERSSYEEAAQREGLDGFHFTERTDEGKLRKAGWRREYFPVYYQEPRQGNERLLGLDMASDPALLETLRRARDEREMVSTPWVPSFSDKGQGYRFLLFQPVFRSGPPFETFGGFAVGLYKVGAMVEESLEGLELGGVEIYIYDEPASEGPRALYRIEPSGVRRLEGEAQKVAEAEIASGLNWRTALEVPGRRWELLFHGSPSFIAAEKRWREWEALAAGLFLTGALGAYLFTSTRRAAELARANLELKEAYENLKRAQSSAIAAEKLAAVGRLTAGVSHEIMNPLFAISAHIHSLLKEPHLPEDVAADLAEVQQQAKRIEKISQDLLSFSRRRKPQRAPLDLNQVVEKTLDLVRHDLSVRKIALEKELAEGLPAVLADSDQLSQVIINLITNARDAVGEDGRVEVRTALVKVDGGGSVELRVEDSGPGIDPAHMGELFEPFFTTKAEGQGTGLGLAICHGIVETHGGEIWAENAPGGGAVFIVRLNLEEG